MTGAAWDLAGWNGGAALVSASETLPPDESVAPVGDDDAAASWVRASNAGFVVHGARSIQWQPLDERGSPLGPPREVATVPGDVESVRVVSAGERVAVAWCRYFYLAGSQYELQWVGRDGAAVGERVDLGLVPNRAEDEGRCGLDMVADGEGAVRVARHGRAGAGRAAVELLQVENNGRVRSFGDFSTRGRLGRVGAMIRYPGGVAFTVEQGGDEERDEAPKVVAVGWRDGARPRVVMREVIEGLAWTGTSLVTFGRGWMWLGGGETPEDPRASADPLVCEGSHLVARFRRGARTWTLRAGGPDAPASPLAALDETADTDAPESQRRAAFTGAGWILSRAHPIAWHEWVHGFEFHACGDGRVAAERGRLPLHPAG